MGNGLGRQRKGTQTREGNGRANAIQVHYGITQSVLCTVNIRKADKTDKTEIFGAWRRFPRPL